MSMWDKLKELVGGKKQTAEGPDGFGPDVIVHHPDREGGGGGGGVGGPIDPGEVAPGSVARTEGDEQPAATPIPHGARLVTGQNVDRYTALAIAQQAARSYCNMDAGLPTIHATEFQRSTVDDGQGHLVDGWEVRIFFNCPGPPIA